MADRWDMPPGGGPFRRRYGSTTPRLVIGVVLVTLGTLWTLDNLGLVDADAYLRWWPVLLLAYGLAKLTGAGVRRSPVAGVVFMTAGAWTLLHLLGVLQHSVWAIWPVFLIAAGVLVVSRSLRGPQVPADPDEDSPMPRLFAFMAGVRRRTSTDRLRGAEITAVMGGVELDLRASRPAQREVIVDVFTMWGGINLIVPEDWSVSCEAPVMMGAIVDERGSTAATPAAVLVIRGLILMGGLEILSDPERDRRVKWGVHDVRSGGGSTRKHVRITRDGITVVKESGEPEQH